MNAVEPKLLTRHPWVTRHSLTVIDYHRMGETGILGERDRVELIEGELVEMSPIGSDHIGTVNALNRLLVEIIRDRGIVSPQNSVRLSDFTEPQPDFSILKPRPDFYRAHVPMAKDVLLVIEVAQSSVSYDRSIKAPLYARSGIAEYWLVRLDTGVIEVYREPQPDGYRSVTEADRDAMLEIQGLPGVVIPAAHILG